jgi:hypothetical protein
MASTVLAVSGGSVSLAAIPKFDNPRVIYTSGGANPGVDPYGLALGDMDNDGDLDVAVAFSGSDNIKVYRNTGSWSGGATGLTLAATVAVGTSGVTDQPMEIAFAHMPFSGSADSYLDLVVTLYATHSVQVLQGDGSGGFTVNGLYTISESGVGQVLNPVGLVVSDFDADCLNDVFVGGYEAADASDPDDRGAVGALCFETSGGPTQKVYKAIDVTGRGKGWDLAAYYANETTFFGPSGEGGTGCESVVNRVVLSNTEFARLHQFSHEMGSRDWGNIGTFAGVKSKGLVPAFVNNNNRIDIATTRIDSVDSTFHVRWHNHEVVGTLPLFGTAYLVAHSPLGIASGTLDRGDALNDIVTANEGDGSTNPGNISVLVRTSSSPWLDSAIHFSVDLTSTSTPRPVQVVVGDLTGDGYNDVVVANKCAGGADSWESISILVNKP